MSGPVAELDLTRFEALTFDCYGTLIDWERGILAALDELLGRRPGSPARHEQHGPGATRGRRPGGAPDLDRLRDDEALLELFGQMEAQAEEGTFRPYRQVLSDVARGFGGELGVEVTAQAAATFADTVGAWPPFDDTVESLRVLASRYRLAIVSNVDDDLFARSAVLLEVPFDIVVTAQQVRSYKPAPAHFHEVMRRLALPRERILHVAQSLHHDIAPARGLGLSCAWVNRRAGKGGPGATLPAHAVPDLEVRDLASLVRAAGLG